MGYFAVWLLFDVTFLFTLRFLVCFVLNAVGSVNSVVYVLLLVIICFDVFACCS